MRTRVEYERPNRHEAFEREALPWIDSVYRFALSLTREPADAQDVVQDTFLRAFSLWHNYEPGSDCRRWLFTICRNAFLRSRERRAVSMEISSFAEEAREALSVRARERWGSGADSAEAQVARVDLAEAIERALAQIPEPFRSALILVDVNDLSYGDAANALGVPVGTLRSRLFRGRRLMQVLLGPHARDLGMTDGASARQPARIAAAS